MTRQVSAAALGALIVSIVAAPVLASTIQRAIGNTIVSTYPDGRTAKLWLQADGAYAGKGRKGERLSGHWTVKGDKICMRQSRPFPIFFSFCAAMPDAGLNTSWSSRAPTGEPITIRVVPGTAAG